MRELRYVLTRVRKYRNSRAMKKLQGEPVSGPPSQLTTIRPTAFSLHPLTDAVVSHNRRYAFAEAKAFADVSRYEVSLGVSL